MGLRHIIPAVAVLVVLGISVAAYLGSKNSDASSAASARNLQQWGIALNLYLIDNDNQLPEVGETPIEADQSKAWYNALPVYLSQTPLADLPPGNRPKPGVPSIWINPATPEPRTWDPAVFYFNYAMNSALQPDPALRSFKIYEIDYPGNVVFMTEVDSYEPGVTPAEVAFLHGTRAPSANVLFCDGHVAPVPRTVLVEDDASRYARSAENGVSWFEK